MVIPEMVERKDGSIIIVSSIGGLQSSTVIGTYNISKASDIMLVKNLAAEFGPHNVRTNAIAPGLFKTDFARELWENPEIFKDVEEQAPLGNINIEDFLKDANLYMDTSESAIESGITKESASIYKIRKSSILTQYSILIIF